MKYEPENKNFNYNEYIHRLGGRQYFHTEELSADEIKSKYKEFQTDGQFVATERIDIYNLNKDIKKWINEEEILIDYGHRPTNCPWMLTKNEIIIK